MLAGLGLALEKGQGATEGQIGNALPISLPEPIGTAGDPVAMGAAFKQAVEAGRAGFLAGLAVAGGVAQPSSPLTGFLS